MFIDVLGQKKGGLAGHLLNVALQEGQGIRIDAIERIEAALFDVDESCLPERAQVMGDGGLLHVELRFYFADADLSAGLCQDVQDLHADRMAECFVRRCEPVGRRL